MDFISLFEKSHSGSRTQAQVHTDTQIHIHIDTQGKQQHVHTQ